MRVIYLDVLLALNYCMDYCILRAAAAISGKRCPVWRLGLAAGFGALYAGGCVLLPELAAIPLRVVACAVMAASAFAVRHMGQLMRKTLLVLLVSFVFGGCVFALEQMSGASLSVGGALYAPVSRKVLLVAAALAYGLSGIVFRNQAKEKRPYGETIRLTCNGTAQEVYLLVDSGNTLQDPITGRPVMVLTRAAALRILPEEVQFLPLLLGKDNAAELVQRAQRAGITGWRLISFQSVGGGGMMPCFHPDTVTREDGSAYDSMVAISGAGAICSGEYDGLIEP
ncbi:MAG: sigma-E processing peptidase SpoIIGA [Eubacteriales bacterium]|nr:sigma-E processing peptidase SpoIIGA [Eubacteriales bacterium]